MSAALLTDIEAVFVNRSAYNRLVVGLRRNGQIKAVQIAPDRLLVRTPSFEMCIDLNGVCSISARENVEPGRLAELLDYFQRQCPGDVLGVQEARSKPAA